MQKENGSIYVENNASWHIFVFDLLILKLQYFQLEFCLLFKITKPTQKEISVFGYHRKCEGENKLE